MADTKITGCDEECAAANGVATLNPPQLLCIARGFAFIFWGLLISFLFFFTDVFIEIFATARIPAYVVGSGLVVWGLFILHSAGKISKAWVRRGRAAMCLFLLQIYFAPFFAWWRTMPRESFLLVNFLCLLLSGMLGLFYINLLVAESERRLHMGAACTEMGVFAAAVSLLVMIFFSVVTGAPVYMAIRYRGSLYLELWRLMNRTPAWAYALILAPCVLTLAASWRTKNHYYRAFLSGS